MRTATKLVSSIKHLNYGLEKMKVNCRHENTGKLEVVLSNFNILNNPHDRQQDSITRGRHLKSVSRRCHCDSRKFDFRIR